jgi:hypothetical protein
VTARRTADQPAAGRTGLALEPPAYGLETLDSAPIQRKGRADDVPGAAAAPQSDAATGLPEPLKAVIEQLSGISLDDVRVSYNSPKPAELGALAYTQGAQIHVGPGQERHLPHEAWHVVQQKQGRVRPTLQRKAARLNTDAGLEAEAEAIGQRVGARRVGARQSSHAAKQGRGGARPNAVQLKRGGNQEGTFIGDRAAIHLHIDIGKPHLIIAGARYDIAGKDHQGMYSYRRCADALDALTQTDRRAVSGAAACRDWLENILDGETISHGDGRPGSVQGSSWGSGLLSSYPARPFRRGQ